MAISQAEVTLALEEAERMKRLELDAEGQKVDANERRAILEVLKKNM